MRYLPSTSLARALLILFCSLPPVVASAQQQKQHSGGGRSAVCVASSIGSRFELKTIGLMVFGNDLKTTSVGAWGLDSLFVQRLAAGLGSRYSVRSVSLPAEAIRSVPQPSGIFSSDNGNEALRAALHGLGNCDYVVIAKPVNGQVGGTNQSVRGVGVLKGDRLITNYFVYAAYAPQVYNGRTAAWVRLPMPDDFLISSLTGVSWMKEVDASYWPDVPQSALQNGKLRDAIRSLVARLADKDAERIRKALSGSD